MSENDELPPSPPEKSRDSIRSSRGGIGLGQRKVTENLERVTLAVREEARSYLPIYEEYADQRPKTRGDCVGGQRPCPWHSCRYNLAIDVEHKTITHNFPDIEPENIAPDRSCALDIADMGGVSLEDVAKMTNLTRERIRQVQEKAIEKVEKKLIQSGAIDEDEFFMYEKKPRVGHAKSLFKNFKKEEAAEAVAETTDDLSLTDGDSISFFSQHKTAELLVTARTWRIYMRTSIEKGFAKRPKTDRQKRLEAEGAPPLIDLPLRVAVAPRHNGVMAAKKKSPKAQQKKNLTVRDNLSVVENIVLKEYEILTERLGRTPNNAELVQATGFTTSGVGSARKYLVKRGLAKASPMGKPPKSKPLTSVPKMKGVRKSNPVGGPVKIMEHQQLPDDATQSAAEVLALPQGPVADAANAIRDQLIAVEAQRTKLLNALHALGALA